MCVCVLNVQISLSEFLVSSWFIFPFDLNLVLLASSCGDEHYTEVGCKAELSFGAS